MRQAAHRPGCTFRVHREGRLTCELFLSRTSGGSLSVWRTSSQLILSVFLRQRGSPESKEVRAPHAETGN
ncbi:DUF6766 family protein [Subtercola boreus]|uniref:DUF6766 family protein n=1 Tax=Subtercola boreus TaxID=120213 RepID=UPI0034606020